MAAMSLGWLLAATLQAAPAPPPAPPAGPSLASPEETAGRDYRIGPEDVVKVVVYGHPDLTQSVVVQADGAFTFPLVGRVEASDLAPPELETRLTELLARGFIRNPQVTVAVQEYRSKIVFLVGELARPGSYPLVGASRLVEILAKAGPMTAHAGTAVVVVRPRFAATRPLLPAEVGGEAGPAGQAEVIRVDLRDIQAGDLGKNIVLMPKDTVFVPAAPKVFVSGRVKNPGAYPFDPGTTVRQAVSLAGGEAVKANRIRVVREVEGRAQELKVGLDDLIRPGDTIVVRGRLF